MNADSNPNYLTNSVAAAQQFIKLTVSRMQRGIERKPWGQYKSEYGSAAYEIPSIKQDPSAFVAAKIGRAHV